MVKNFDQDILSKEQKTKGGGGAYSVPPPMGGRINKSKLIISVLDISRREVLFRVTSAIWLKPLL